MATQAQIDANRRNAQHSTGPRTAEGKAVASRNAVRHGLLSRDAILPGEDPAQFEAFLADVIADQKPRGAVQRMIVIRIAHLQWKLGRIPHIEAATVRRSGDREIDVRDTGETRRRPRRPKPAEIISLSPDPYIQLQVYEQRLERSLRACLKELRDLRKERIDEEEEVNERSQSTAKSPEAEPTIELKLENASTNETEPSPCPLPDYRERNPAAASPVDQEKSNLPASPVDRERNNSDDARSNKRTQWERDAWKLRMIPHLKLH